MVVFTRLLRYSLIPWLLPMMRSWVPFEVKREPVGCRGVGEEGPCRVVSRSSIIHDGSQLCLFQRLLQLKFGTQIQGLFLEEHFSLHYMQRKQVRAAKQTVIQDEFQNWKIERKLGSEKVLL